MAAIKGYLAGISKELMIQEAMYGFIMGLTLVTAVYVGLMDYSSRESLCLAIWGMIFVWGMIDMLIFFRMDTMSLRRTTITLVKSKSDEDRERARADIDAELDGTIFDLVDAGARAKAVDAILESELGERCRTGYKRASRANLASAIAAALVTFATAIPVILCVMLIDDFEDAFAAASVISCVALFFIGYIMTPAPGIVRKILSGLTIAVAAYLLTVFATYLGG